MADKSDAACTTITPQPEIRSSLDKGSSKPGSREEERGEYSGSTGGNDQVSDVADAVDSSKGGYFAYFRTKEFYIVLIRG